MRCIAALLSLPVKLVPALRTAYLILDDIWLYYYTDKNYTGLIEVLFRTTEAIQAMKFNILEKFLGWSK